MRRLLLIFLLFLSSTAVAQNQGMLLGVIADPVPSWVLSGGGISATADYDFANSLYYQRGQSTCVSAATCITTSRASTGYAANTSGVWTSFSNNVPRITNQGLLIEEARTNTLLQSATLTNAVWNKVATTVTGGQADPVGGTSASLLTPLAANTVHVTYNFTTLTAAVYTWSALIKPSGYNFAQITAGSGVGTSTRYAAVFNLLTGAVTQTTTVGSPTNTSSTATVFSNGWVLLSVSMTATADAAVSVFAISPTPTGTPTQNATLDPTFTGDGTSGGVVWNTQLELGTFVTSPIPTTIAAVSRAADLVTITNVPTFSASRTLYAQGVPGAPNGYAGGSQVALECNDGSLNNRMQLGRNNTTSTADSFASAVSNTTVYDLAFSLWSQNTTNKLAGAYTASDQASAVTGVVQTASSALVIAPFTTCAVGNRADLPSNRLFDGYVSRIAIWPSNRLSNAALTTLTQ